MSVDHNPGGNINIIGLGIGAQAELSTEAKAALIKADLIVGSPRQRATVEHYFSERSFSSAALNGEVSQGSPNCADLPKLKQLQALLFPYLSTNKEVVILASGDPLFFGIGRWFSQQFKPMLASRQLHFFPAVSSIQVACHALGKSLQDVEVASLHGRPLASLRARLRHQQDLVLLTDSLSYPQAIAELCVECDFAASEIIVCEDLGYPQQQIRRFHAQQLATSAAEFSALNVVVIEARKGERSFLPQFPGIPDQHFITGRSDGRGMISKREVRLQILSFIQAQKDEVIWDVGAGCGGVAVELAYWQRQAQIYAIEFHNERLGHLFNNRARFGVEQNLKVIDQRAPDSLEALPDPHKVFIGGSDGELSTLLEISWQRLPVNGVLVASAVIDSTREQLRAFAETLQPQQVESVELAVQRGQLNEIDGQQQLGYQAKLPVEIFRFVKTRESK